MKMYNTFSDKPFKRRRRTIKLLEKAAIENEDYWNEQIVHDSVSAKDASQSAKSGVYVAISSSSEEPIVLEADGD